MTSPGPVGRNDAGMVVPVRDAVATPWTTGFEDAFCGYDDAKGWCYTDDASATYTTVASPVHSGRHAAAFTLNSGDGGTGKQARCAREGTFPTDAYYGAWFYLPSLPQDVQNWNLFHFNAENDSDSKWNNLLDVTLVKTNGGFGLAIIDDRAGKSLGPAMPSAVPVGSWFYVELRFVRSGTNGELTLYQDHQQVFDVSGINTDPYQYDQWYVGNLVASTSQPDLTVYVDDVSLSTTQ